MLHFVKESLNFSKLILSTSVNKLLYEICCLFNIALPLVGKGLHLLFEVVDLIKGPVRGGFRLCTAFLQLVVVNGPPGDEVGFIDGQLDLVLHFLLRFVHLAV